ncbi:hypothetical protein GVO57_07440 [Sphingomonas changnyeongensis]|uniref:Uncharacterized protein n=1 Tax=Sphingomonas changnyeongensis TaxID=2698679 RepID=A0A7Z2NWI3_9SPHN|nr:hypothetical protein [Sphingomonas changnyeongensis]QHL90699.1 hypothetical protein GVO57_07440 [Sphingomonas changnyeongensis]
MTRRAPRIEDGPTQPRPANAAGYLLDGHGLPLSGPARLRALDGRPDPADAPADTAAEQPKE